MGEYSHILTWGDDPSTGQDQEKTIRPLDAPAPNGRS
jgi:hypothetical protein